MCRQHDMDQPGTGIDSASAGLLGQLERDVCVANLESEKDGRVACR
jgi:hypothetical protein